MWFLRFHPLLNPYTPSNCYERHLRRAVCGCCAHRPRGVWLTDGQPNCWLPKWAMKKWPKAKVLQNGFRSTNRNTCDLISPRSRVGDIRHADSRIKLSYFEWASGINAPINHTIIAFDQIASQPKDKCLSKTSSYLVQCPKSASSGHKKSWERTTWILSYCFFVSYSFPVVKNDLAAMRNIYFVWVSR